LRLPVNSSHHQAIAQPAPGMRIVARCPEDGVIEAIEAQYDPDNPWFFMAVQWHPERSTEISAASRALFSRLVAEAARHADVAATR
jgi:putative glutamine amidotransferase